MPPWNLLGSLLVSKWFACLFGDEYVDDMCKIIKIFHAMHDFWINLDGRHILKFEFWVNDLIFDFEQLVAHSDVLLVFRFLVHMLRFSKFFGPSPRKHRLTVYRWFEVIVGGV